MTIMVELIGEQYLPNVLPVRHYKPDKLLLIYTTETEKYYQRLKTFFKSETKIFGLRTDAYDVPSITSQIENALHQDNLIMDNTSQSSLLFNLTGGTKSMVIAAQQIASRYQSPIFYLQSQYQQSILHKYTWFNGQITTFENEFISKCISLEDMLNIHIGLGEWHKKKPQSGYGGFFERAVINALSKNGYEVMSGITFLGGQLELDGLIQYQNQFGIIEAKTGKDAKNLEGVRQLSTAVHVLSNHTKKFLVIDCIPNSSSTQKLITGEMKINTINLLNFTNSMTSLSSEDEQILLETIDSKMKPTRPLNLSLD